jgi:hypothetical protein
MGIVRFMQEQNYSRGGFIPRFYLPKEGENFMQARQARPSRGHLGN